MAAASSAPSKPHAKALWPTIGLPYAWSCILGNVVAAWPHPGGEATTQPLPIPPGPEEVPILPLEKAP